jgi:outer membrane protein OmpA-like peptidoglycan-associated protein
MNSATRPPRDDSGYNLAVLLTLLLLLLALFLLPRSDQCCSDGDDQAMTEPVAGMTATGNPDDSALLDQDTAWPGCEAVLAASYVSFESGSGRLTEKGTRLLDRLMACLEDGNYLIVGHTDNQGDEQSNLILSRQRAESVRAYLIGKGMDPDRLSTDGAGESDPIASNETEAGRARNRRIEFIKQE